MTAKRGQGRVYLRGSTWWIQYYRNGHQIRESAETDSERAAVKFLQKRLAAKDKASFVGPSEKKLTLDDLEAAIKADYVRQNRRSWATVEHCLKPLKGFFKYDTLLQIGARIEEYQDQRLKAGAARSTVNRECAYLRRGFRLLHEAKRISELPMIRLLSDENVREGFINAPEFETALAAIKCEDTRDIIEFLYRSAWRSGEAKSLEWSKVDTADWVIRLSRKNEKTKQPRTLALPEDGELRQIIERRVAKRFLDCPLVFHRNGKPIKRFDRAFNTACKAAGMTGLVPHDMRRSGIRNFTKAGIGESVGMSISGHRTNSVYKRYNIVDEEFQRQSLQRVQEHQQHEIQQRRVVPIRKAG